MLDPEGAIEPWAEALLADLAGVRIDRTAEPLEDGHTRVVAGSLQGFIPLEGVIDLDAERARLDKAIAEAESDLEKVERKLGNESFLERAPAEIVDKERGKQAEFSELLTKLRAQRSAL